MYKPPTQKQTDSLLKKLVARVKAGELFSSHWNTDIAYYASLVWHIIQYRNGFLYKTEFYKLAKALLAGIGKTDYHKFFAVLAWPEPVSSVQQLGLVDFANEPNYITLMDHYEEYLLPGYEEGQKNKRKQVRQTRKKEDSISIAELNAQIADLFRGVASTMATTNSIMELLQTGQTPSANRDRVLYSKAKSALDRSSARMAGAEEEMKAAKTELEIVKLILNDVLTDGGGSKLSDLMVIRSATA